MTRVVGVHGVGNHRPGDGEDEAARHLSRIWHRHLSAGSPTLGAEEVAVAYYADLLRPPGRQGGDDVERLSEDAEAMVRAWLEEIGVPEGVRQGWGTVPLRQALSWVAERHRLSPGLVRLFVSTFFREVAAYLDPNGTPVRDAVRERVVSTVRRHRPRVVLAHSLGSVVAYEALWRCPDVEVELLVTLGSPLALPHAVFHRLDPNPVGDRGARPPGVARWVNIADRGDLVALPPRGVSRRFHDVDLDVDDVVHAFDFHLAANYLRCSGVVAALNDR